LETVKTRRDERQVSLIDAEKNKILVWDNDKIHKLENWQLASKGSEMLMDRYYDELFRQSTRGQSIVTLKSSDVSHFFIGICKDPIKDWLLRFTIRARNDTLWTPAKQAMINRSSRLVTGCSCRNGRFGMFFTY
jgi:hypothetical protein